MVSELQCEFCKKEYDSVSILKHIAKNEPCKLFYGSRFGKMKIDHKRKTNKKDVRKQRKRYASNPEVWQRKKKYYQEEKKMQAILQEESENNRRKDEAIASIPKWEEDYRDEKKQGFQQFK